MWQRSSKAYKTFKEKQKEAAVRSYRHSVNIKNKMQYSIDITERTISGLVDKTSNCKGSNSCSVVTEINRIKDHLINIKSDSDNNINDWGDILTEELIQIANIEELQQEIYFLEYENYELGEDDDQYKDNEEQIKKLTEDLKEKKKVLSSVGKTMLIVNRDSYNEMFGKHIEKESRVIELEKHRSEKNEGFSNLAKAFAEDLNKK